MSKKFIVTRNGEQIGENHPTREAAESAINQYQFEDGLLAEKGWIRSIARINYSIIERK